jgi:tetratricopeptide (TPR) repeat protein
VASDVPAAAADAAPAASEGEKESPAPPKPAAVVDAKPAQPERAAAGRRKTAGEPRRRGRSDHIGDDGAEPKEADAGRAPAARPSAGGGGADSGKAEFYARMGDRDLANGDFLGAATNYNKARELDPNNAAAILGLGEIALSQGATDAAVSHLRRAAKLRPRSARAHTLLGEALLAAGRRDQAAASFKRALRIAPGDDRAQNGLGEAAGDSEPPPDSPRDEPEETELQ